MQSSVRLGTSSGRGHLAGSWVASRSICADARGAGTAARAPPFGTTAKHMWPEDLAELEPGCRTHWVIPAGSSRGGGGGKGHKHKGWHVRAGPSLQGRRNALSAAGRSISRGACWRGGPWLRGSLRAGPQRTHAVPTAAHPARPHRVHDHLIFHVDFFTAEMGINGYTRTPEPPPGGKRQILIMSQPKGRGAYKQPSGEEIKGWPQPVYKKKREATTQMLPKHTGGRDSGWKSTPRDPLYLDAARSRKGHCFFEEMGTPLPDSTHPDHNANYDCKREF